MGTKYCYIVQEMWMEGTPSNATIQDLEAFETLQEARQYLKRTHQQRASLSPE